MIRSNFNRVKSFNLLTATTSNVMKTPWSFQKEFPKPTWNPVPVVIFLLGDLPCSVRHAVLLEKLWHRFLVANSHCHVCFMLLHKRPVIHSIVAIKLVCLKRRHKTVVDPRKGWWKLHKAGEKKLVSLCSLCTHFGVSRVVCGAHARLLCAVDRTTSFAVNAELVAGQQHHRAWSFPLHQPINAEYDGQAEVPFFKSSVWPDRD